MGQLNSARESFVSKLHGESFEQEAAGSLLEVLMVAPLQSLAFMHTIMYSFHIIIARN